MGTLPRMFRVRQNFAHTTITDVPGEVRRALEDIRPSLRLRPGATVAVGVGSRGVTNIAAIAGAVCNTLKEFGAEPFIFPAMGSHGGATAEGQRQILAHYGVTEEAMGVPIKSSLEVITLGKTSDGVHVYLDRNASEADFILPINRIKPHTDFKGEHESGLIKMMAVGFGKYNGAIEYHRAAFHLGYPRVFRSATEIVLSSGRVLCGVAILENARHETARIVALTPDRLIEQEIELLKEAKRMMPRLPCHQIDLLIIDEIGKDISGTGMDTNITGRGVNGYITGTPVFEGAPGITRILVCDLTEASGGNGIGIGMADFTTARFMKKLDLRATIVNGLTALTPNNAKIPVCFDTDREAIEVGLKTAGVEDLRVGRVVRIKNTLTLGELEMSESYLGEIKSRTDLSIISDLYEIQFDESGNLLPQEQ